MVGSVTDVGPVVTGLTRTMEKIYHSRGIAIDCAAPDGVRFRGERQDLEVRPRLGQARAQVLGQMRLVVGDKGARIHAGIVSVTMAPPRVASVTTSEARSP